MKGTVRANARPGDAHSCLQEGVDSEKQLTSDDDKPSPP